MNDNPAVIAAGMGSLIQIENPVLRFFAIHHPSFIYSYTIKTIIAIYNEIVVRRSPNKVFSS